MEKYIKINVQILEWDWWTDINTFRLFFYMLLKANEKDKNYKGIVIPKGSFVSSIAKISEETNLTLDEARTALKHLKSTNEITSEGTNRYTIFTVTNYDLYQTEERAEQPTDNKQTINLESGE